MPAMMWRCCVRTVHNLSGCKQLFACKCCVRSFYYINKFVSKHRCVSTNSVQNPVVNESSLVKVGRDMGLPPQSLLKAVECSPVLSQASLEQLKCFFSCILDNGLNCEDGLAMLTVDPNFLTLNPSKFSETIELWRNCQLGEENMKRLLMSNYSFLQISMSEIAKRIPLLTHLCGTKRNLCNLLQNCPLVLTENWTAVQNKIEYLQTVMKFENVRIVKSMALNQSLDTIRKRHVFLERCGRYIAPDPKVDPLVANKNPSLSNITDTSDKYFATKVASLSLEEYEVFCELFTEELDEDNSNYDSDSDSEQ
ncbi:hypothetical protein PR048_002499 [Dryococelus australis]|uniref:Uncharacterized protein n=1 Tax=Dryococelus australis TaxID=614101 RepID=A0ABQ9IKD1_9NEOP|nr:hypothetical protein PR048_002499 [Dryococelus australis]